MKQQEALIPNSGLALAYSQECNGISSEVGVRAGDDLSCHLKSLLKTGGRHTYASPGKQPKPKVSTVSFSIVGMWLLFHVGMWLVH